MALIFFAYVVWLAVSLHLAPFTQTSIIIIGSLLVLIFLTFKRPFEGYKVKHAIITETIFFSLLAIFAYLKYRTPAISGTEKPMDFALINGIFRSQLFPPSDAWYANVPINYYYYGHYLVAFISKLTNIPTRISYNLALPLVFSLTGLNIFGIITNHGKLTKKSYLFAILGIVLVLLAGNFATILSHPSTMISWWDPSRVIPNTITEFPYFSLLLGDVHAHVLALIFGSLFLSICLAYFNRPSNGLLIAGAFVLASHAMTNPWDLPGYLLLAIILIFGSSQNLKKNILRLTLGSVFVSGLVLPFLIHFQPILPINDPKPFIVFINNTTLIGRRTLPSEFLTIWGTHLAIVFLVIFQNYRKIFSRKLASFPFILCAVAFFLLLFCEFFYINDFFTPPLDRMNTVFKFYYQAWLILGIGAVALLSDVTEIFLKNKITFSIILILLLGNLGYLVFATPVRLSEFQQDGWTLDGLKYLSSGTLANQSDLSAINWLNQNVTKTANIVESAADPSGSTSYTTVGRISAATGLPTIIGWSAVNHEGGWRNSSPDVDIRVNDVRTIYESSNSNLVKTLLNKYSVTYIIVGGQEKTSYPKEDFNKFSKLGKKVFSSDLTDIYQVF